MRIAIITAAAASLLVASCNESSVDTQALLTTAQADAVDACQFLPTAETITNIVAAANPIATTAEQIANVICAAVKPLAPVLAGAPAMLLAAQPPVGVVQPMALGVKIHGRFVPLPKS